MRTRMTLAAVALLAIGWPAAPARAKEPAEVATKMTALVEKDEPRLLELFKHLHQNPELSFQETKTAALVVKELKDLGFEVHTGIGKTGVVGILKNGPGPVVMFRGDMDALPVREATGLPWDSKAAAPAEGGGVGQVDRAWGHGAQVT